MTAPMSEASGSVPSSPRDGLPEEQSWPAKLTDLFCAAGYPDDVGLYIAVVEFIAAHLSQREAAQQRAEAAWQAAAEAVRDRGVKELEELAERVQVNWGSAERAGVDMAAACIRALPLPSPAEALAQRERAAMERALRWAWNDRTCLGYSDENEAVAAALTALGAAPAETTEADSLRSSEGA